MGRQKANIHYIYKTTCNVTGRYYIGMHSTNNLDDGYMGSGKRLRYSLRKHGKENHVKEILEFFDSRELLVEREKEIVNSELICDEQCMNLKCGGTGGFVNKEHEEKAHNGLTNWLKQKWLIDISYRNKQSKLSAIRLKETHKSGKIKYGISFLGKKHSEDSKILMRKSKNIGKDNSQYGTMWITNDTENKKINKNADIPAGWYKGRKKF